MPNYTIEPFSATDLTSVTSLFEAYAASLNIDLSFQDFASELAELPGKYSPPQGCLLVARDESSGAAVGCVCIRKLNTRHDDGRLADQNLTTEGNDKVNSTTRDSRSGSVPIKTNETRICEMKRLYVHPNARGARLGLRLATAAIDAAKEIGYDAMRLDTLPHMVAAIKMYDKLGFRKIAAYYDTPLPGTIFLELDLTTTTPPPPATEGVS